MSRHRSFFVCCSIFGGITGHCCLWQSRKSGYHSLNKTISNSDWSVAIDGKVQNINFTGFFYTTGQVLKN